ncbi:M24 family metallopeptidase [Erysipelothrix sp. HDW6C]|uniref:aminopeptidase P family protein n=1 Tax=Erysipelothrix sp. HDW6C TaxID=2714930 RepID=UPI0014075392|nr:aminopeptidase P family protein [Erysipelothrix sp. HDW6C]QIK69001.1 M24 family metallopeptidase [Erysipelothrix sp. HDW6C]
MNKDTYSAIRKNIMTALPKNTVTFLFSGMGVRKSADSEYPFYANRNFYYATGIEEPEAVLVFDKDNDQTILFLRDIDPNMEKWVGYFMKDIEAQVISGIEDIRYFSEFDAYVESVLARDVQIGLDFDHDTLTEAIHGSGISFADYVGEERVINIFEDIVSCRMVKLPEEVEAIKEAIEVTNQAILSSLEMMKPGNNENDVAARFLYEGNKAHGELMFDTILAGGKNATVLHYVENNNELHDGDLLLFDLGIKVNGYGADISRTFPINGKFTERQREVYQVVLDTFHAVNEAIRPGISIVTLNDLAKEYLAEGCIRLGLIDDPKDVSRYYYHSIGHSLGLDTHDVWLDRDAPLVQGNVITNEPGLYIAEEGIGIRIETDVLVTEESNEDLGPQIIREIDEIEAYLAK